MIAQNYHYGDADRIKRRLAEVAAVAAQHREVAAQLPDVVPRLRPVCRAAGLPHRDRRADHAPRDRAKARRGHAGRPNIERARRDVAELQSLGMWRWPIISVAAAEGTVTS